MARNYSDIDHASEPCGEGVGTGALKDELESPRLHILAK